MAALALVTDNAVSIDHRAAFLMLRDELHDRARDLDLRELWADLSASERIILLRSAELDPSLRTEPLEQLGQSSRDAIRAAIHRMSDYSKRLRDRLEAQQHPSHELAANARRALLKGDNITALHFLSLIEKGAK